MPSEVTVRRLTAEDLDVARDLRLRALADAPGAFLSTYADAAARTEKQWLAWLSSVAVWAAFADGVPVGMVGAWRSTDDPGVTELISMWVAPEARGARIAGRLTEAVVAHARDHGDTAVHLEVVHGNDGAEAAYLRGGFRHIPPRKERQRDRSMWLEV